jgi:hypothetical protein
MSAQASASVALLVPAAAVAVASFVLFGLTAPGFVVLVVGVAAAVALGRRVVRPLEVFLVCVGLAAVLAALAIVAFFFDAAAHGGFE